MKKNDSKLIMDFRYSWLCKVMAIAIIASFIAYDLAWAYPDRHLSPPDIFRPTTPEQSDAAKISACVAYSIFAHRKNIHEISRTVRHAGVSIHFDRLTESNGAFLVPCEVSERGYAARLSPEGEVLEVLPDRVLNAKPNLALHLAPADKTGGFRRNWKDFLWYPVHKEAFTHCMELGLGTLPVISDGHSVMREYREKIGAEVPAAIVAHSSPFIFPPEAVEYAMANPGAVFVIMPRLFFADPRLVKRHIRKLARIEESYDFAVGAVEEKEPRIISSVAPPIRSIDDRRRGYAALTTNIIAALSSLAAPGYADGSPSAIVSNNDLIAGVLPVLVPLIAAHLFIRFFKRLHETARQARPTVEKPPRPVFEQLRDQRKRPHKPEWQREFDALRRGDVSLSLLDELEISQINNLLRLNNKSHLGLGAAIFFVRPMFATKANYSSQDTEKKKIKDMIWRLDRIQKTVNPWIHDISASSYHRNIESLDIDYACGILNDNPYIGRDMDSIIIFLSEYRLALDVSGEETGEQFKGEIETLSRLIDIIEQVRASHRRGSSARQSASGSAVSEDTPPPSGWKEFKEWAKARIDEADENITALSELLASLDMSGLPEEESRALAETPGRLMRAKDKITRIREAIEKNQPDGMVMLSTDLVDCESLLYNILNRMRQDLEAEAKDKTIAVEGNCLVRAPEEVIRSIFKNLIANANKYTLPNGKIWINLDGRGDDVIFTIRDDGVGIPHEYIDSIWEGHIVEEQGVDNKRHRSGTGLPLVRDRVTLLGGEVRCHSAGLGQGSTFTVSLPKISKLAKWLSISSIVGDYVHDIRNKITPLVFSAETCKIAPDLTGAQYDSLDKILTNAKGIQQSLNRLSEAIRYRFGNDHGQGEPGRASSSGREVDREVDDIVSHLELVLWREFIIRAPCSGRRVTFSNGKQVIWLEIDSDDELAQRLIYEDASGKIGDKKTGILLNRINGRLLRGLNILELIPQDIKGIVVDTRGFREERRRQLRDEARNAVQRAMETGKPQFIYTYAISEKLMAARILEDLRRSFEAQGNPGRFTFSPAEDTDEMYVKRIEIKAVGNNNEVNAANPSNKNNKNKRNNRKDKMKNRNHELPEAPSAQAKRITEEELRLIVMDGFEMHGLKVSRDMAKWIARVLIRLNIPYGYTAALAIRELIADDTHPYDITLGMIQELCGEVSDGVSEEPRQSSSGAEEEVPPDVLNEIEETINGNPGQRRDALAAFGFYQPVKGIGIKYYRSRDGMLIASYPTLGRVFRHRTPGERLHMLKDIIERYERGEIEFLGLKQWDQDEVAGKIKSTLEECKKKEYGAPTFGADFKGLGLIFSSKADTKALAEETDEYEPYYLARLNMPVNEVLVMRLEEAIEQFLKTYRKSEKYKGYFTLMEVVRRRFTMPPYGRCEGTIPYSNIAREMGIRYDDAVEKVEALFTRTEIDFFKCILRQPTLAAYIKEKKFLVRDMIWELVRLRERKHIYWSAVSLPTKQYLVERLARLAGKSIYDLTGMDYRTITLEEINGRPLWGLYKFYSDRHLKDLPADDRSITRVILEDLDLVNGVEKELSYVHGKAARIVWRNISLETKKILVEELAQRLNKRPDQLAAEDFRQDRLTDGLLQHYIRLKSENRDPRPIIELILISLKPRAMISVEQELGRLLATPERGIKWERVSKEARAYLIMRLAEQEGKTPGQLVNRDLTSVRLARFGNRRLRGLYNFYWLQRHPSAKGVTVLERILEDLKDHLPPKANEGNTPGNGASESRRSASGRETESAIRQPAEKTSSPTLRNPGPTIRNLLIFVISSISGITLAAPGIALQAAAFITFSAGVYSMVIGIREEYRNAALSKAIPPVRQELAAFATSKEILDNYLAANPETRQTKTYERLCRSNLDKLKEKIEAVREFKPQGDISISLLRYSARTIRDRAQILKKYNLPLNTQTIRLRTEEEAAGEYVRRRGANLEGAEKESIDGLLRQRKELLSALRAAGMPEVHERLKHEIFIIDRKLFTRGYWDDRGKGNDLYRDLATARASASGTVSTDVVDQVVEKVTGLANDNLEIIKPLLPPNDKPILVIFDVHGTLLEPNWKKPYEMVFKKLANKDPPTGWIAEFVLDKTDEEVINKLNRQFGLTKDELRRLLEEARLDIWQKEFPQPIAGAIELVESLTARGIPVIINSASRREYILRQLESAGFLKYIPEENIIGTYTEDRDRYDRTKVIDALKVHYPGHTIVYFDDAAETIRDINGSAICFGVPQGGGSEFETNRNRLIEAGSHYIIRDQYDWKKIDSILAVPVSKPGASGTRTSASGATLFNNGNPKEISVPEINAGNGLFRKDIADYLDQLREWLRREGDMNVGIYPSSSVDMSYFIRSTDAEFGIFIDQGSFEVVDQPLNHIESLVPEYIQTKYEEGYSRTSRLQKIDNLYPWLLVELRAMNVNRFLVTEITKGVFKIVFRSGVKPKVPEKARKERTVYLVTNCVVGKDNIENDARVHAVIEDIGKATGAPRKDKLVDFYFEKANGGSYSWILSDFVADIIRAYVKEGGRIIIDSYPYYYLKSSESSAFLEKCGYRFVDIPEEVHKYRCPHFGHYGIPGHFVLRFSSPKQIEQLQDRQQATAAQGEGESRQSSSGSVSTYAVDRVAVRILPEGRVVYARPGENLLKVLERNGVRLNTACGGQGKCGKCGVSLLKDGNRINVLSCQTRITGENLAVSVPLANRVSEAQILALDDVEFLKGVKKPNPPVDGIQAGTDYALAVDIGTTTVAASLIRIGESVGGDDRSTAASLNWQAERGADVITRISYVDKDKEAGLEELQGLAVSTINSLIAALIEKAKIEEDDIKYAVFSGNSVMTHLVLGIDPHSIGQGPDYAMVDAAPAPREAQGLGIEINPQAPVFFVPCVHGFLGGDIVSDLLIAPLKESEELSLMIDLGTNGEIVLGDKNKLWAASCAMGPAFEGAGISNGVKAQAGAIEAMEIDKDTLEPRLRIIGGVDKPIGLCGTGLVDAVSQMHRRGIINNNGRIDRSIKTPRVRPSKLGGYEYVIWQGSDGDTVAITEKDIETVLMAKAAVWAAINVLLNSAGKNISDVKRVYVAGGFGRYLDIKEAVHLGLLPALYDEKGGLAEERYESIGNGSLKGAILMALDRANYADAQSLAKREIFYVDLMHKKNRPLFDEAWLDALPLKTDLRQSASGDGRVSPDGMAPEAPNLSMVEIRRWMDEAEIDKVSKRYAVPDGRMKGVSPTAYSLPSDHHEIVVESLAQLVLPSLSNEKLSFKGDLSGAEVMIIGPGEDAAEVIQFLEYFPAIKAIHIIDVDEVVFHNLETALKYKFKTKEGLKTKIYGYCVNVMELPRELKGRIDMVFDSTVFDRGFFDNAQFAKIAEEIAHVLKPNGAHIYSLSDLYRYLSDTDPMEKVEAKVSGFGVMVKRDRKTARGGGKPGRRIHIPIPPKWQELDDEVRRPRLEYIDSITTVTNIYWVIRYILNAVKARRPDLFERTRKAIIDMLNGDERLNGIDGEEIFEVASHGRRRYARRITPDEHIKLIFRLMNLVHWAAAVWHPAPNEDPAQLMLPYPDEDGALGKTSYRRASSSGEEPARETLLTEEPAAVDYYVGLRELNLKLIDLSYQRVAAASRGDSRLVSRIQADIQKIIEQLKSDMQGLGIHVYPTEIHRVCADLRDDAIRQLTRAVELIQENNEPAANACILAAANRLSEEIDALLSHRLKRRRRQDRVVLDKKGNIRILQQVYVRKEPGTALIPEYRPRVFSLLWQAFRSIYRQTDTELAELMWLEGKAEEPSPISLLQNDNPRRALERLTGAKSPNVLEKGLAITDLTYALRFIDAGYIHTARGLVASAINNLEHRREEIRVILDSLDKGRYGPLRDLARKRSDKIKWMAREVIRNVERGKFDEARNYLMGLARLKDIRREPDFYKLLNSIWRAHDELENGEAANLDVVSFDMNLVRRKAEESEFLWSFIERFRKIYKETNMRPGAAPITIREAFLKAYLELRGKKGRVAERPRYWWSKFYQPAFVSMKIPNPQKPSQNIPNPVFEAVSFLIWIQDIDKLTILSQWLGRKKGEAKQKSANLHAAVNKLLEEGKAALSDLGDDEFANTIASALSKDYSLSEHEEAVLFDAGIPEPPPQERQSSSGEESSHETEEGVSQATERTSDAGMRNGSFFVRAAAFVRRLVAHHPEVPLYIKNSGRTNSVNPEKEVRALVDSFIAAYKFGKRQMLEGIRDRLEDILMSVARGRGMAEVSEQGKNKLQELGLHKLESDYLVNAAAGIGKEPKTSPDEGEQSSAPRASASGWFEFGKNTLVEKSDGHYLAKRFIEKDAEDTEVYGDIRNMLIARQVLGDYPDLMIDYSGDYLKSFNSDISNLKYIEKACGPNPSYLEYIAPREYFIYLNEHGLDHDTIRNAAKKNIRDMVKLLKAGYIHLSCLPLARERWQWNFDDEMYSGEIRTLDLMRPSFRLSGIADCENILPVGCYDLKDVLGQNIADFLLVLMSSCAANRIDEAGAKTIIAESISSFLSELAPDGAIDLPQAEIDNAVEGFYSECHRLFDESKAYFEDFSGLAATAITRCVSAIMERAARTAVYRMRNPAINALSLNEEDTAILDSMLTEGPVLSPANKWWFVGADGNSIIALNEDGTICFTWRPVTLSQKRVGVSAILVHGLNGIVVRSDDGEYLEITMSGIDPLIPNEYLFKHLNTLPNGLEKEMALATFAAQTVDDAYLQSRLRREEALRLTDTARDSASGDRASPDRMAPDSDRMSPNSLRQIAPPDNQERLRLSEPLAIYNNYDIFPGAWLSWNDSRDGERFLSLVVSFNPFFRCDSIIIATPGELKLRSLSKWSVFGNASIVLNPGELPSRQIPVQDAANGMVVTKSVEGIGRPIFGVVMGISPGLNRIEVRWLHPSREKWGKINIIDDDTLEEARGSASGKTSTYAVNMVSFEGYPEDLCGLFRSDKGELSYVAWDATDERFVAKPFDGSWEEFAKKYDWGVRRHVTLARDGTEEAASGEIYFVRFAPAQETVAPLASLDKTISEIDFMTPYSFSAASDIAKAAAAPGRIQELVAPRNVAIDVDLLPLTENGADDELFRSLIEMVVKKEKRLDAKFGRNNPIHFEFISLSGNRNGFADKLKERYGSISCQKPDSGGKAAQPGFMITNVEPQAGSEYNQYRILALGDPENESGKAGLYLWSSILDLAVSMTLLLDMKDRAAFYPGIADLYAKLLKQESLSVDLDVMFGESLEESRRLSMRLRIPPASYHNLNELKELYERMARVLAAA